MRLGAHREATRKKWAALPALAASAPLGGPRPGASVLAVTPRLAARSIRWSPSSATGRAAR